MPSKYLSNFWITLEMLLIKCEINFILASANYVIFKGDRVTTLARTDIKLYVAVL